MSLKPTSYDLARLSLDADTSGIRICWGHHDKAVGCTFEEIHFLQLVDLFNDVRCDALKAAIEVSSQS